MAETDMASMPPPDPPDDAVAMQQSLAASLDPSSSPYDPSSVLSEPSCTEKPTAYDDKLDPEVVNDLPNGIVGKDPVEDSCHGNSSAVSSMDHNDEAVPDNTAMTTDRVGDTGNLNDALLSYHSDNSDDFDVLMIDIENNPNDSPECEDMTKDSAPLVQKSSEEKQAVGDALSELDSDIEQCDLEMGLCDQELQEVVLANSGALSVQDGEAGEKETATTQIGEAPRCADSEHEEEANVENRGTQGSEHEPEQNSMQAEESDGQLSMQTLSGSMPEGESREALESTCVTNSSILTSDGKDTPPNHITVAPCDDDSEAFTTATSLEKSPHGGADVQVTHHKVNKRKRPDPRQKVITQNAGWTGGDSSSVTVKLEKPDDGYEMAMTPPVTIKPTDTPPRAIRPLTIQPQVLQSVALQTPISTTSSPSVIHYRFRASSATPPLRRNAPPFNAPKVPLPAATSMPLQPRTILLGANRGAPQGTRFIVQHMSAPSHTMTSSAPNLVPASLSTSSHLGTLNMQPAQSLGSSGYTLKTVTVSGTPVGPKVSVSQPVTILIPQSLNGGGSIMSAPSFAPAATKSYVMNIGGKPVQAIDGPGIVTSSTVVTSALPSQPLVNAAAIEVTPNKSLNMMANSASQWLLPGQSLLPHRPTPSVPSALHMNHRQVKTCRACGDTFHTEIGLVSHMKRRSMSLTYNCTVCKMSLGAFNKCSMLGALTLHKCFENLTSPMVDLSKVIIRPLSQDSMSDSLKKCLEEIRNRGKKTKSVVYKRTPTPDPEEVILIADNSSKKKDSSDKASEGPAPVDPSTLCRSLETPETTLNSIRKGASVCPECNVTYETRGGLAQHFVPKRKFKGRSFQCDKCLMLLPTKCSFEAHVRVHNRDAPYVCPECGEGLFGSRDIFMKHVKKACLHFNRLPNWVCPICRMSFLVQSMLEDHVYTAHAEAYYKCQNCPTAFKSMASFDEHNCEKHLGEALVSPIIKCPLCKRLFENNDKMKSEHLMEHIMSMDGVKLNIFKYKCLSCADEFEFKYALTQHVMRQHPSMIVKGEMCNLCGDEFQRPSLITKHLLDTHPDEVKSLYKRVERLHKCDLCDKMFAKAQSLVLHRNVMHQGRNLPWNKGRGGENQEAESGEASKSTGTQEENVEELESSDRREELEERVGEAEENGDDVEDQEEEEEEVRPASRDSKHAWHYDCEQCQMVFEDETIYLRHMKKHRFIKMKKSGELKSVILKGRGQRIRSADIASRSPSKSQKRPAFVADTEPQLSCSECDLMYFDDDELEQHLLADHKIKPTYSCHLCGVTYTNSEDLQTHIKRIHEGKVKADTYICCLCREKDIRKTFAGRANIIKHIRSHKVPKAQIDKILAQCCNVKTEVVSDDSMQGYGDTASREPPPKRLKLEGDLEFTCAKCDFVTLSRDEFRAHISKHQRDKGTCQCQECGLCFAVNPALKRHLFMVHKIHDFDKYLAQSGQDINTLTATEANIDLNVNIVTPKNGLYKPKKEKVAKKPRASRETDESPEPGQCSVCYKRYKGEAELKKHMRTHGMAFIRSKRRGSTEEMDFD